jgi:ankyrin repeat protein
MELFNSIYLLSSQPEGLNSHSHLQVLIKNCTDLNYKTNGGVTPLMYASRNNHYKIVDLLLKHGADPNLQDNNLSTALTQVSYRGHYKIVALLLKYGADPNFKTTDYGITSLMCASCQGHVKTVRVLLKYGADPNIQNENGKTALMFASELGHKKIVKRLLKEKNININLKNKIGYNALDMSTHLITISDKNRISITKLLLQNCIDDYDNINTLNYIVNKLRLIIVPMFSKKFKKINKDIVRELLDYV